MGYSTQLITEAVLGKHNITDWVKQEISSIKQSDINLALERATTFLTKDREDLASKARVEELVLLYGLEDASQLIVDSLLSAVILIKPEILTRAGKDVAYPGVSPMQALATAIGMPLHNDRVDAVQTGIEILSFFEDMGIYDVRIVREADRAVNRGGVVEVHGDSAVIVPTLAVSLELHLRIKATQYLPPMLVRPQLY